MASQIQHLRRFSYWMDEGIRVPGTNFRFGLDPILGLVPGMGDALGAILAGAVLLEAQRQGISRYTLTRMAGNVALDAVFGAVPLLGDFFDAAWKSNLKNMDLLERHVAEPTQAHKADKFFVVLVLAGLFALSAVMIIGGVLLTAAAFRWLLTGQP